MYITGGSEIFYLLLCEPQIVNDDVDCRVMVLNRSYPVLCLVKVVGRKGFHHSYLTVYEISTGTAGDAVNIEIVALKGESFFRPYRCQMAHTLTVPLFQTDMHQTYCSTSCWRSLDHELGVAYQQ